MIEKLYTVEEVAELASVTGRTIRNYLKSGRLVGRKIGGQWRFPESEVQRLLTGGDPQAGEEPSQAPLLYENDSPAEAGAESAARPAAAPAPQPEAQAVPPVQGGTAQPATQPVFAQVAQATPSQASVPQASPSQVAAPVYAAQQPPVQKQPEQNLFAGYPQGKAPQPAAHPAVQGTAGVQQSWPREAPPVYAPQGYAPHATQGAQTAIPGQPAAQPQGQPVYSAQQPGRSPAREYLVYNAPAPLPDPGAPPLSSEPSPEDAYAPYAYGTPYPHAPSAEPPVGGSPTADGYAYTSAYPQGGYEPAPIYPASQPGGMAPPAQTEPVSQSSVPVPKAGAEVPRPQASAGQSQLFPPAEAPVPESAPEAPQAEPTPAEYAQAEKENPVDMQSNEASQATSPAQIEPGLPQLSDVGLKVVQFVAEVHDCSEAPQTCTVLETVQALEAAKQCIAQLCLIAEEESAAGLPCESYVEYDERFAIARYTLLGTSRFLARCLQLIG